MDKARIPILILVVSLAIFVICFLVSLYLSLRSWWLFPVLILLTALLLLVMNGNRRKGGHG